MSGVREARPGDLVVFCQRSAMAGVYAEHNVALVELVRDTHYTGFPWRLGDRRWDTRWFRIARGAVAAVLPMAADAAALAERLNVLRNERDMHKSSAERVYLDRVADAALLAEREAA